jgi:hypothetical protein
VELGQTEDPNTVSVTRVLVGTDKAVDWMTDMTSFDMSAKPGQIANDATVAGRADDYPNGGNGNDAIWRLNIQNVIDMGTPAPFRFTLANYSNDPPAALADLGALGSPMLDAYDSSFLMGTTFAATVMWTPDDGVTDNSSSLLPTGVTDTRGVPGFNSDHRPSGQFFSHGTGALFGKSSAGLGATDSIIIFEMSDNGVVLGTHRYITFPPSLTPCDGGTAKSGFEGAHYHGSSFWSGPWGTLAVNSQGHIVAPVDYLPNIGNDDGNNQALLWTDGAETNTRWGIVAYHGQEWDPVNLPGWTLGRAPDLSGFGAPFSNPALDDYDNVFFTCEYETDTGSIRTGLFRASPDDQLAPSCWTVDLILSEFDSWTDSNGHEVLLTDLRSTGSSGKPANGAIGSNSLVGGLLPGVDPLDQNFDPTSPFSTAGVVFTGTALIDETPPSNNMTEVACNDDNMGECGADTSDSYLSGVPLVGGTTYFIEVTSRTYNGAGGTLTFSMTCDDGMGSLGTSGADLAAADECSNATVIPTGSLAFTPSAQDTTVATLAEGDPLQSCTILSDGVSTGGRRNSHSVWYRYTPTADCTLTVSACGSTPDDPDPLNPNDNDLFYNTVVSVHTGPCGDDGLVTKGRFATTSGFNLTVQDAAEIANVDLNDTVEITAGAGVTPDFYEVIAKAGATLTLHTSPGDSTGDVAWQVNDNEFFNEIFYLKGYEALPPTGCTCGDINGSGGQVDLNDFATFSVCFSLTGPAGDCTQQGFDCSDLDGSGTVDLNDFSTFAVLFNQVSTATVPNCL